MKVISLGNKPTASHIRKDYLPIQIVTNVKHEKYENIRIDHKGMLF